MGRSRVCCQKRRTCYSMRTCVLVCLTLMIILGIDFLMLAKMSVDETVAFQPDQLDKRLDESARNSEFTYDGSITNQTDETEIRPYHLGCWLQSDRRGRFPGTSMIKPNMKVIDCLEHCQVRNFTYAGIKNGVECWCNSTIGDYIPSHACYEPCPGDKLYRCGGRSSMDVYVVNETLPKYPGFDGEPRKLLILAYMRTGSTFTAEFFNQYADSFFIFEPFHKIGFPHPSIIQHLFTCQFERVPSDVLYRQWRQWAGHIQKPFVHFFTCMRQVGVSGFHRCLSLMKIVCEHATLRVVKEIQINMTDAILMKELLPDLKILHLIRDPRAVTYSRIRVRERNTPQHAVKYCNDVTADLKAVKTLPSRDLFSLHYETLSEHPLKLVHDLYKFIRLPVTSEVVDWLNRATGIKHSCGKINCRLAFSTMRKNSSETAYRWKAYIHYNVVRFVDSKCQELYKRTGYLPITSESELRDSSNKHRTWS